MAYTLITGASSGIGRELATLFAGKGHPLVLIARRQDKLEQLETELKDRFNAQIILLTVDLAQPVAATRILQGIRDRNLVINYLVNNAGFHVKGPFDRIPWEKEKDLLQIQCMTHTELTKGLLPMLKGQTKAGILNVASTGAFVPGPFNAIYCAAKAFVLSFSEALAEELSGTTVSVTALCPGGTDTAFQDQGKRRGMLMGKLMKPAEVARSGYEGLMRGQRIVIPGLMNRTQVTIARWLPKRLIVKLTAKMV